MLRRVITFMIAAAVVFTIWTAMTGAKSGSGSTSAAYAAGSDSQDTRSVAYLGNEYIDPGVSQKIVPIISIGSGTRVGGALVTGSKYRLAQVRAVAQLEGSMSSVRVRVLVPVSTENVVSNIRRVPETSVAGLVDIKL